MDTKLAWHYTTGVLVHAIRGCGKIVPLPEWQPYVWFSLNETGEPSVVDCVDGVPFIREGNKADGVGRIGVLETTASLRWPQIRPKMQECHAHRLEQSAQQYGASPDDWRLAIAPINKESWKAVQIWTPSGWNNLIA
jgi:hypothetical protein